MACSHDPLLTRTSTLFTPLLGSPISDAVPLTVMEEVEKDWPLVGELMLTVGGLVSGAIMVTTIHLIDETFPALSVLRAAIRYEPSSRSAEKVQVDVPVAVFHRPLPTCTSTLFRPLLGVPASEAVPLIVIGELENDWPSIGAVMLTVGGVVSGVVRLTVMDLTGETFPALSVLRA